MFRRSVPEVAAELRDALVDAADVIMILTIVLDGEK